jgi:hypothetical protein
MNRWIVNASPVICLAKAGYLNLLFMTGRLENVQQVSPFQSKGRWLL